MIDHKFLSGYNAKLNNNGNSELISKKANINSHVDCFQGFLDNLGLRLTAKIVYEAKKSCVNINDQ